MRIRRSLAIAAVTITITSSDPDHHSYHNLASTTTTPRNTANKTSSSIIVCVLNQSPWDVADLASSQLEGGLLSLTGTASPVFELAIGSQSLGSSVKLRKEETKQQLVAAAASGKSSDRREDKVKIRAEKSSAGRVVVSSNKPKIRSGVVRKQQGEVNDSADNPNEFYYYSGFGPHWHWVKRRETVTKPAVVTNKVVIPTDQELRNEGSNKRDIGFDDDDDDNGVENDEGMRRPGGRKRVKSRLLKSLM